MPILVIKMDVCWGKAMVIGADKTHKIIDYQANPDIELEDPSLKV